MTKGLRVWLDDDLVDRAAPPGWTHVVTASEAIELLKTGSVIELSLDHDLGDDLECGTGNTVLAWIADQHGACGRDCWPREGITLHTANPVGRERMARAIRHEAGRFLRVIESRTAGGKPRFEFERRETQPPREAEA